MRTNVHAFTETGATSYPGYISVNQEEDGRITVAVRTRGGNVPAVIDMNRDQLEAMYADVGAYLAATAPAPEVAPEAPSKAK